MRQSSLSPLAPLLASALLLQGCLTEVSEDILHRSSSTFVPPASVHIPPAGNADATQVGVSAEWGDEGGLRIRPDRADPWFTGSNTTTRTDGSSHLDFPRLRGAVQVSRILAGKVRLEAGAEGSRSDGAGWVGFGAMTASRTPVEAYLDLGGATVRSNSVWTERTRRTDREAEIDDSTLVDTTLASRRLRAFWRFGIHVGPRAGGPWGEFAITSQNLFDCPRSAALWEADIVDLSAGWLLRTPLGNLVPCVRAFNGGTRSWSWAVGGQWIVEIHR